MDCFKILFIQTRFYKLKVKGLFYKYKNFDKSQGINPKFMKRDVCCNGGFVLVCYRGNSLY